MRNLLLVIGLVLHFQLFADHISGGYITYTCLGNNDYLVKVVTIRDCGGSPLQAFVPLGINSFTCGYQDESQTLDLESSQTISMCGIANTCDDGFLKGYQKGVYSGVVTLPFQCADWEIYTSVNARNSSLVLDGNVYLYAGINNAGGNCYSSIDFNDEQVALACVNHGMNFPIGVVAPSNLTVTSLLVSPQKSSGNGIGYPGSNVDYDGTYNFNNPINSPGQFTYDNVNFEASFTPNLVEQSDFAVRFNFQNASGSYVGYTMREIQILSTNICNNPPSVFGTASMATIMEVTPFADEKCIEISITDIAGDIVDLISVEPSTVIPFFEQESSTSYTLNLCFQYNETACEDLMIPVKVKIKDENCLADMFHERTFNIKVNKQVYCPEYQFITKRSPTTVPVPPLVKASNTIFVGDNLPVSLTPSIIWNDQAQVTVSGNVEMIAGVLIDFSCLDGTSGLGTSSCVDLVPDANGVAHIDVDVIPNHCSNECPNIPPDVEVIEIFSCSNERLRVEATGDNPPFLYQLNIDGQTYYYTDSIIDISDIVSQLNNGAVPYQIIVHDAVNNQAVFDGSVIGTKRFYEPILNNKIYFNYEPNDPAGEPGYYYAGNLAVFSDVPAYITDSINTTPPWYGATAMSLTVFDRWGNEIMRNTVELENGVDWSMDNGEFYWNGKKGYSYGGNDPWGVCYEGSTDFFAYTLTNRNCYQIGSPLAFDTAVDEESQFLILSCLDDDWNVVQTKSASVGGNDYETQVTTGVSRIPSLHKYSNDNFISCYPNPMKDEVEITSSDESLENLQITDQTGKVVLSLDFVQSGQRLNVKGLSPGIYILTVDTDFGNKSIKLVRN